MDAVIFDLVILKLLLGQSGKNMLYYLFNTVHTSKYQFVPHIKALNNKKNNQSYHSKQTDTTKKLNLNIVRKPE